MRRGWLFLAIGLAAWCFGEILWGYYEVLLGRDAPFPSAADAAYVAGYPFLMLGVLSLSAPRRRTAWIRTLLDASILVAAASGPVWYYVIRPLFQVTDTHHLSVALNTSYTIGDLVLWFGLAVAASRGWSQRQGVVLGTLACGLGLFLVADISFSILTQESDFQSGSLLDVGWVLGYGLICVAATLQSRWQISLEWEDTARSAPAWRQALGLVLLAPCLGWFILVSDNSQHGWQLPAFVGAMVGLVSLRSLLTLADVLLLNKELDLAQVRLSEANEQLLAKSRQLSTLLVEAIDLGRRDPLTGLLNHAAILKELNDALESRSAQTIVAMIDIDYMKHLNDRGGHQAGDQAIREVAARLAGLPSVIAGRYGGDEFLCFRTGAPSDLEDFRQAIRLSCGELTVMHDGLVHRTGLSYGTSMYPGDATSAAELVKLADDRLYDAKRARPRPIRVA